MFKNAAKLIPFLRPLTWDMVIILISGLLLAVLSAVPALLIGLLTNAFEQKNIIDQYPIALDIGSRFMNPEDLKALFDDHFRVVKLVSLAFPATYLIYGIVRFYNYYKSRYLSEVVANELRYTLLDKMIDLNTRFFAQVRSGSGGLLSRSLNDTIIIQQGMNQYVDLLREPFVAVVIVVAMFWVNFKLSLACVIVVPIISYVIRNVSKALRGLSTRSQENLDQITKSLKETVDGIRIIHAYNLETFVRTKFRHKIDHYNAIRKKIAKRMEIASPINEFVVSLLVAGMCIFVGQLIFKGESNLGEFFAFVALAANLDKPIKKIQQAIVGAQQTDVSIARVFEIIDNTDHVKELPVSQQQAFPKDWTTIEFKNIQFQYENISVLKGINLTVRRGESIAIVGESGSGKSTLVNLLERFIDPVSGQILIGGVDTQKLSLKQLRNEIAYVSQDTFLFDETVEENIRFGDTTRTHEQMVEAARKANALKFIEKLPNGFLSNTGERGSNFSGGEKQRISIARAIYKDAPILILDEATSALDSASEAEVQKGIASLLQNRTAFIIAHRLSTVQSADRIIVMDAGQIAEQGTHEELIKLGKVYAQYYKLQEMSSTAKDIL